MIDRSTNRGAVSVGRVVPVEISLAAYKIGFPPELPCYLTSTYPDKHTEVWTAGGRTDPLMEMRGLI